MKKEKFKKLKELMKKIKESMNKPTGSPGPGITIKYKCKCLGPL